MIRCQKAYVAVLWFASAILAFRWTYLGQPKDGISAAPGIQPGAPLAILFTSFSDQPDKLFVYTNTIQNWASFLPQIQPLLFTTFHSGPVIDLARQHGWKVFPNPSTNQYGSPILKDMYRAAMDKYNATFYGFANGDILFDSGLSETLLKLQSQLKKLQTSLLFGTRSNYDLQPEETYQHKPLWKPQQVATLAKTNATLFRPDSFDYFFVTRQYPFDRFKRLVISRTGFDTYFVAITNHFHLTTIDGTGSIFALHQTDRYGNWLNVNQDHDPDKGYNRRLIGEGFNYQPGYANQARYGSVRGKDGKVFLKCRKCKDKKDLH